MSRPLFSLDFYWLWQQLSDISNPQRAKQQFSVLQNSCSFTSPSCYLQSSTLSPSLSVVLYTTMQSVLVHQYLFLALASSSSSLSPLSPLSPVPFACVPPSFLLLSVCLFKADTVLHPLEFSLWLPALGKGFPGEGLDGREKWIKVTQRGAEEFRQKESRRHSSLKRANSTPAMSQKGMQ